MSIVLELPLALQTELASEAARLGMPLPAYVLQILAEGRQPNPKPSTGADLLAYWHAEGLIGTRPEITDAPTHSRTLREQAQRRGGPD